MNKEIFYVFYHASIQGQGKKDNTVIFVLEMENYIYDIFIS